MNQGFSFVFMIDTLFTLWTLLLAALHFGMCLTASAHVILNKRHTQAAIGWMGVIWLTPYLGTLLYIVFGINRISRRAKRLRAADSPFPEHCPQCKCTDEYAGSHFGEENEHFCSLAKTVGKITGRPLLRGNRFDMLINGDACFPAMLQAIDDASRSIALSTYIFDVDRSGEQFIAALQRAAARGVEVRVLVDSVGARYSRRNAVTMLRRLEVPAAAFSPTLVPWRFAYANLRNHRKILVLDGRIGFTGGMNIREGNVQAYRAPHAIQDMHFRIAGPVVADLQRVFVEDWFTCTNEDLHGSQWFPELDEQGDILARGVADGPDEDFDKTRLTLLGGLACARHRVAVVTPYFLPDNALTTALIVASLRGVQVDIVLPAKSNLSLVQWAMTAEISPVLERGCRVWLTPPPFDHTKIMLVDDYWSMIGSANWDPRSLRLNFEFNVECYGRAFSQTLREIIDQKISIARRLDLAEIVGRNIPTRLRDGIARLAKPYI